MERLAASVRSPESGLWAPSLRPPDRREAKRSSQAVPLPSRNGAFDRLRPTCTLAHPGERGLHRTRVAPLDALNAPLVGTACLEAEALPLHQQIVAFSRRAYAAGAQRICLVPIFLLAGVHVVDDIPAEVDLARQCLPGLAIDVCPHLGSHPGLKRLLRSRLQATESETLILLAHGSRRPSGNEAIAKLAEALEGTAAFWAVAPDLETQVIHHLQTGVQRLAILPYFLFAGTTTDAITRRTEELAERFPQLGFHLLPPLGPSLDLARLVADLALDRVPVKAEQTPIPMQRVAFRHTLEPPSLVS
jgi:sirohydrochlorin cobaltochelatase